MVEQLRLENTAMTFDEVSMERSKNFVKALQELKNLRPQLYTAAEYCEKSYLHNEQKQMVLDNLKDYAVRALVNAVDHLGTVAYKLTDLFEQQTVDVSTVDVKITCLNQQILTCQAYSDKECLRQHQLSTVIPGHHKHYTLPASINRKTQNSLLKENDERRKNVLEKQCTNLSDVPASKTLSWHLASETKPGLDGVPQASNGGLDGKASGTTNRMFHMFDGEVAVPSASLNQPFAAGITASSTVMSPLAVTRKDSSEVNKSLVPFRSLDNPARREMSRPPTRSKSVLSSFFVKHKSSKLK